MHKIHFRLGQSPGPCWGAYDAPQIPSRVVRGYPSIPTFPPSQHLQRLDLGAYEMM